MYFSIFTIWSSYVFNFNPVPLRYSATILLKVLNFLICKNIWEVFVEFHNKVLIKAKAFRVYLEREITEKTKVPIKKSKRSFC